MQKSNLSIKTEVIPVGKFSTSRHEYNVTVRKNGGQPKVHFGPMGDEQQVSDLGRYLSELEEVGLLKNMEVDFKKIEELTGRDHYPPSPPSL